MRKRLTKTGNGLALVLDRPLLAAARIGADTTLEVSTDVEAAREAATVTTTPSPPAGPARSG